MNAILVDQPGGPEAMRLGELPTPAPGPGEALIELAAIGVNYLDVYHRSGVYPIAARPFVPGSEGAGTVRALGADVATLKVGDRVAYADALGSYAQQAIVPADKLVRIPAAVSFEQAAALMLQGMTAHYLAHDTRPLNAGDTALIHAGAGGVGLLLTQIAKARGAVVLTTVSTAEKECLSREAGADHVLRYTECDFAEETRRITGGRGADVVYDSVGASTFERSLSCLRPRGMLVLYGASSGQVPPFDLQRLARGGSLFVTRPRLHDHIASRTELERRAADLFAAVERGTLRLRIEHTYPLAEAARAHRDLESRATTGKLLLIP